MAKKKKIHLPGEGKRGTACGAVGTPSTDGRVTCKHCIRKVSGEFIYAAQKGEMAVMRHIISTAKDLLGRDDADRSLVESKNLEVTEFLFGEFSFSQDVVTKAAALLWPESYGRHQCLEDEELPRVLYLLDKGADPSALLEQAAKSGDKPSMELMLDRGANPSYGLAPAAKWGYYETVKDLLDRGADVNFNDPLAEATCGIENYGYRKDEDSNTYKIIELLLSHKPTVSDKAFTALVQKGRKDFFNKFLELGANVNASIGEGYYQKSVLCVALGIGVIDMVITLLKRGADPLTLPETTRELFSKLTVDQFTEIKDVISVSEVMSA